MNDNYFTVPLSGNCDDLDSYSHVIPITRIDCSPTCTDKLLSKCGEVWNCLNPMKGAPYYNPVKAGDKFHFQTLFIDDYNGNEESPTDGWGTAFRASICDVSGVVVSTDHTLFASRYYVGWDGSKSIQVIEMSVDLITANFPALTCFSFQFEALNTSNNVVDSVCSNHYYIYNEPKDETILISSITKTDCCGSSYQIPVAFAGNTVFKYSNEIRIFGEILRTNTEFSKEGLNRSNRTKTELDRIYELRLRKIVPPYLFAYLTEIVLAGQKVLIDSEEYFIDELDFSNELKDGCEFIGTFELSQSCDLNFKC